MEQAHDLADTHGTPLYVYDLSAIQERARQLRSFSMPYGLTVRYAMKANPSIIRLLASEGLQFDASSSYEVERLLKLGVPGKHISLSSQQPAHNLSVLQSEGVACIATSMHQLHLLAAYESHAQAIGLRINPGMGSGHNNRLTTGGHAASFGLWHEHLAEALIFAQQNHIVINRLQIHVGTGGDPSKWGEIFDAALSIAARMPDVVSLDIGGGYKIAYTDGDTEADMEEICAIFGQKLSAFANKTGRRLHLEIEPGRWLVAHHGYLLTEIVDIVDTGSDGYTFLRTNTGMNDFMRPAMYGAQHRMHVLNTNSEQARYIVVGHCCETGDILTPAPHDPESILPRTFNKANIGDILVIDDAGAYCAAMSTKGYNAFPEAREVCI
jgi:diaminopimelate decarboxylase